MSHPGSSTGADAEAGPCSALWIASLVLNAVLIPIVLYVFIRIIPHFSPALGSLGAKLPLVTTLALTASCFLEDNWLWFMPLHVGAVWVAFRLSAGRRVWIQGVTLAHAVVLLGMVIIAPFALVYPILELSLPMH